MTASSFEAVIRSAQKNLACALDLTQQFHFNRLVMRPKRCHLTFEIHPLRESALRILPFLDLRLLACWGSNGAVSFASGSAQGQHDALLSQLPGHFLEPGIAVVKRNDCTIDHVEIEATDLVAGPVGTVVLDPADLRHG